MAMIELTHPRRGWTARVDERVGDLTIALWRVTDDNLVPEFDPDDERCLLIGIQQSFGQTLINAVGSNSTLSTKEIREMFEVRVAVFENVFARTGFVINLDLSFQEVALPVIVLALGSLNPVVPLPRHRERPRPTHDPLRLVRRALDVDK